MGIFWRVQGLGWGYFQTSHCAVNHLVVIVVFCLFYHQLLCVCCIDGRPLERQWKSETCDWEFVPLPLPPRTARVSYFAPGRARVCLCCLDGRLYSATAADWSSRDSLIYSKPLRTEQHNSHWLNGEDRRLSAQTIHHIRQLHDRSAVV